MMLTGVLRLMAASIVPGGGVLLSGWSPATALALYWIENTIGGLTMAVRIAVHQRVTGLAGHGRGHMNASYTLSNGSTTVRRNFRSFLAEFLVTTIAFNIGHLIFLFAVMGFILPGGPDLQAIQQGLTLILVCHGLALTFDLRRLDEWPFARLKKQANLLIGRVVLVHLAILGGMVFLAFRNTTDSFFGVFLGLKFLSDLGTILPQYDPREPPRWLVTVMKRIPSQTGESFEDYWRRTRAAEIAQAEHDEQVIR
jgi:hypothetical protein